MFQTKIKAFKPELAKFVFFFVSSVHLCLSVIFSSFLPSITCLFKIGNILFCLNLALNFYFLKRKMMMSKKGFWILAIVLVEAVLAIAISIFNLYAISFFPFWSGFVFFATLTLCTVSCCTFLFARQDCSFYLSIGEGMTCIFTRLAGSQLVNSPSDLPCLNESCFFNSQSLR